MRKRVSKSSLSQRIPARKIINKLFKIDSGANSSQRPYVNTKILNYNTKLLYDSGADISIIEQGQFAKALKSIPRHLRPKKIKIKLKATGASGNKLKITSCYLCPVTIQDRKVVHPMFVGTLRSNGIVGIDLINRLKLSYNAESRTCQISKKTSVEADVALVNRKTFIKARSAQEVKVTTSFNGEQLYTSSFDHPVLKLQCADVEAVVASSDRCASVWIYNISNDDIELPRGTKVGNLEPVKNCDLIPWDEKETFSVKDTTPMGVESGKKRKVPVLTGERRKEIEKQAKLDHLDSYFKEKYLKLLFKFNDILSLTEFEIGQTSAGQHAIPLTNEHSAIFSKQFPLSIEQRLELIRQVKEWKRLGVIRECESEFNSSMFCVKKKPLTDDPNEPVRFRVVQDFRPLNAATRESNFRLPLISECLDHIARRKPKRFSSIDLRSGFWQVPLLESDQHKSAFWIPGMGQHCWTVAPQGLVSLPASFQRIMQRVFQKQIVKEDIEVYLDDILAFASDDDDMLRILEETFLNLRKAGLTINLKKCDFNVEKLVYLGFEVDKDGYRADPLKIAGITKVQLPRTLKGVRSFVGMLQFYRDTLPRFSQLIKPLTSLTSKMSNWSGGKDLPYEAKQAFFKAQKMMGRRPFLHHADMNLRFHLFVDGSLGQVKDQTTGGLSACLVQYPEDDETKPPRAIGFASRGLTSFEKNYTTTNIESCACVFAITHFEKFLSARKFVLHSDHKPLVTFKQGSQRRTHERFKEFLAEKAFELRHIKGENNPSDYPSRHTSDCDESVSVSKQCSEVKISEVQCRECEEKFQSRNELFRHLKSTGHVKEQETVSSEAPPHQETLGWCSDATRPPNFLLSTKLNEIERSSTVTENKKPTEDSQKTDKESDNVNWQDCWTKESIDYGVRENLTKVNAINAAMLDLGKGDWQSRLEQIRCKQIKDPLLAKLRLFVETKSLPENTNQRSLIKRHGPSCFIDNGILKYHSEERGKVPRELIVLPAEDHAAAIAESHSSLEGGHESPPKMVERIRKTWWWPGITTDAFTFANDCPVCRKNKKKDPKSCTELKLSEPATRPFERCSIDLLGPWKSQEGGKKYILVIIDAFSKFAQFVVVNNKTAEEVADKLWHKWIVQFGAFTVLLSDQGKEFNNKVLNFICEHMKIDKRKTAAYHPQTNGQAEVTNKKIIKYLKSMVENKPLDWEQYLPSCQLSYNTSVHRAIKASPFSLLFGIDARTPLNDLQWVSRPYYGNDHQSELFRRLQFARNLAYKNNMEFKDKYKTYFDAQVNKKDFPPGCLVWLYSPDRIKVNPKICSPFFGPFVVLERVGDTNCVIQHLTNKKTKFVNINNLRRYDVSNSHHLKRNTITPEEHVKENADNKAENRNKGRATPPPQPSEYDVSSEIVILNPNDPVPKPIPLLKEEVPDTNASSNPDFSGTSANDEDIVIPSSYGNESFSDITDKDLHSSRSSPIQGTSNQSFTDTLNQNWPSPADAKAFVSRLGRKGRNIGSKLRTRQLPTEDRGPISRATAQAAGVQPPSLSQAEANLKKARKSKNSL